MSRKDAETAAPFASRRSTPEAGLHPFDAKILNKPYRRNDLASMLRKVLKET